MRMKNILTLTLIRGPRHTFLYALGIMACVPRTGPKAGAPPPGTQPEALLPFMPAVFPPTPGPGMLPGMIPQMPGFQPGQPGRIPQTPLPMFPVQAAICCPHCTGPVWLSVDANGSVTSQAITLASASSTAPAVAAQAQDEPQVRSRIPSTPEDFIEAKDEPQSPSPPDASAGPPPPQSGGAKKRSPSKTAAPADATKADSPMVVPKAVFVSAPWAAAQKAAQQDLAAPTLWTMGTAPPPAAPAAAPATRPAPTTPPPAAPAAPQPLAPWPSSQGSATSSPGSARPSTAAPRSRSPPAHHGSGLQKHAWSSIFRAVSYKETFKDLC